MPGNICGECRFWSEMIAQANPELEALCLNSESPHSGRFTRERHSCPQWKSGEPGAVDDPTWRDTEEAEAAYRRASL